jgi:iron complex outermembrane receptor protein
LVKFINFDGGYRSSEYTDVGNTKTYKLALEYAPTSDVKFRASFNRAVRAPNIDELFQPDTVGLFSGQDPCSTPAATAAHPIPVPKDTAAQCANMGVSAAQYGTILPCPASQCSALGGGTTTLRPESADTKTYGVVFTPTFFHNFSLTVDYYDIKVNNVITGIAPNVSLANCAGNAAGAGSIPYFCALIHRDANGSINSPTGFVSSVAQNTGFLQVKGVDIEANYRLRLSDVGLPDLGSFSFNLVATNTLNSIVQPTTAGVSTYDCAGMYGPVCGNPDPKWRSKLRITWSSPWNFDLSGQWRYLGGVALDTNSTNKLLNNGYVDNVDAHLPAYSYFDLSGNWRIKDGFTVRGGVNNVFDKDPPITSGAATPAGAGNGNTFPGVYDALGRTFFVGLTAKF